MKRDITRMNHDAIQRQVEQHNIEKINYRNEKAKQDEQFKANQEIIAQLGSELKNYRRGE